MKRNQKVVTLILTAVVILSLSSISVFAETKFSDVSDNAWYINSMDRLIETGAIGGFPDGTFRPQDNVAVDQFIKIVVIATGNKVEAGIDYWAQPYIDFATDNRLVESDEFDSYNRPITRGEMARILVRCLKDEKYPDNYVMYQSAIKDFGTTSDELREYILKAYVTGLMNGYPDKTFKYKNRATRAEAVTMVHRLIDQAEKTVPDEPEQLDADGFIIPDLRIVYYFSIGTPKYYDIFLNNYEKYLGKNYKVKIECVNYPELNVREQKWGKKWFTDKCDMLRLIDPLAEVEGALYRQFDGWYLDREKNIFEYKVGMKIQFRVTLDNGNKVKNYYAEGIIQDREFI